MAFRLTQILTIHEKSLCINGAYLLFLGRSNGATAIGGSGLPLPGATVVVENTNRGVTTDFDGNFSINAQNGEVLIVSYVGYQNSRITVGNQSNYNISLLTDNALEEVVVTTAFF